MKISVRKIIASALSLCGLASLSFGVSACAVKSTEVAVPVNSVTTKTAAPTDGSLPTAHTGTENLAYISQVFSEQTQYHAYSYTYTNASITTQITRGYRDYKDGILISSDITYSSVVKSGTQKCTVFNDEKGEYEVYARSSGEPESSTTAVTAEWKTDAPIYYSEIGYNRTYGLLQTELTNFILNDDSVLESGEVHENPDGTYTQSFVLDPVVSTYYYAFCMKTNGGLSGYPSFQSVTLSVTFTDKWLPLSVVMHDVSTVNKGVVVTSVSDTTCEFTYGEVDEEHFAYYDSYFKAYLGDEDLEQGGEVDEALVLDVTNVLSNGFSKIMDGGAQFETEVSLGKNVYRGFVFVALDLENPLETLEIRFSLGKTLRDQGLYIEYKNGEASAFYGNDFALDVNIATLKPVVAEITDWVEGLAKTLNALTATEEGAGTASGDSGESDMLADLMKAMKLEVNGGEAKLVLQSNDLLGLGIGVNVQLFFGVEQKAVTFRGGTVNGLSVGGSAIDLNLVLRSTTAEIISREKTDAAANLTDYVADAFALMSSDLIKVNAKLDGNAEGVNVSALKGVQADVTAYVDIDGVTVGAEAEVSYNFGGNKLSAALDIWYDYDVLSAGYGKVVLTLKRINGAPVSVQVGCDIAELTQAIGTVLTFGGAEAGVSLDGVVAMVNKAFTSNFSSLLTEVYADKTQIKLGVNVDTVLLMLGVNAGVKFGSCTLAYARGESVYGGELSAALPAIGFSVKISGAAGEIEKPDTTNCLDLTYLVEDITALAKADLYEVKIDFDGDKIEQTKGLKAEVTAYADIKGLAAYANVKVGYKYNNLPVSAELSAWYTYDKDTNGTVVLSLDNLNGVATSVRVKAEINQTIEAVKELLNYCNVQLDMPELSVNVQLEEVLTGVLTADLSTLIPELATTADGLKLGVNADEILKLFNVNIPLTVGTVNLAYSHANCNLVATVPALGLGVTVGGLQGEIEKPDTTDCLDLVYLVEDITTLAKADLYEVKIDFDSTNEQATSVAAVKGLKAEVTAYADIKGLAAYANVKVGYTYNDLPVSAELSACYNYDKDTNGTVVLSLDNLNGVATSVRVKAEINQTIEAVKELLAYCNIQLNMPELSVNVQLEEVLTNVLTADLSTLIPELATTSDGLKLGVNADEILKLFNVNIPLTVGTVNLAYSHANCNLVATVPALGLGVTVGGLQGEIEKPDTTNCLDLTYLVEDITALAKADLYEVKIDFDGDKIEQTKGLKAEVTAYADIKGLAAYANVKVGYKYNDLPVSAELSAWYTYDKDTNGTVVLSLDSLNGVATSVRVKAEINQTIEAVKELLAYCNVQLDMPELSVNVQLEEVLTGVLTADLSTLIPELATTADGLKLGVNADEILKLFNVNIPLTVGTVNLAYSHANCNLVATVPALGLSVTVGGAAGEMQQPPQKDVLDLVKLVELVNSAAEQVKDIINNQSVSFVLPAGKTYLYLDGLTVNLWGKGEIGWKQGDEYVALDLVMSIAESGIDSTAFKLLYRKNVEGKPLVRLALNEVGIDVYPEDIDEVTQGFNRIYQNIVTALGGSVAATAPADGTQENGGNNGGTQSGFDFNKLTSNDKIMTLLFRALSSTGWVNVLNDMTLTADSEVIVNGEVESVKRSLVLTYAADNAAEVRVSTNGNIALYYDVKTGEGFAFGGEVQACAANGALASALDTQFNNMNMSSSKKEGSASFVKLAYDFLFEAISSVSVKDILGSDTYAVTFSLIGDNCNISALEGVTIDAEVYFTGASGDNGKLAEADLNVVVAGVTVSLNAITERVDNQTYFFVNLRQVANFALPDLKLMATQDSLYDTIKSLITVVNDTNVLEVIGGLVSKGGEKVSEDSQIATLAEGGEEVPEDTISRIADIIEKIMNFNFGEAVEANKIEGVTKAVLNLDNIALQLGLESELLGTVEITINHKYHSMKTSGKALVTDAAGVTDLKEWISLSSEKTVARDYSKFDRSQYISIEFLPTLIDDVIKFATDDNGDLHDTFTLSGNIKANLVGMINVEIDPCTLTAKIGKNGISFSLVMHVNKAKVIGIGIPESTVGLTYRNGLLTLAKGLNSSTPQYKVMTFEYFLDHMLTKDSVLEWLLDISGWDLIMSFVNVDINSGLTSPEDISLFDKTEQKEDQEISMYDFVDALRVVLNGKPTAAFGNYGALESDLGVYDNYYGFALNAGKVTNGVLTKLNAAITHGEGGLETVLASGAIQSYVTFSAELGYKENWTEEYVLGGELAAGKTAPDLYQKALDKAAECNHTPDFGYFVRKPENGYDEQFGCMSVTVNNGNYSVSTDYSRLLNSHTLTIITESGKQERFVRHGSTVHLFDNAAPVYADNAKEYRILYSTSPDSVGAAEIQMNGDVTVYAIKRRAVNVIFTSGGSDYVVYSFEGDGVPTSVSGLDTIEGPFYENGNKVGVDDKIPSGIGVLRLHGTFVNSEVIVNYVKYTFDAATKSYIASGKAAGFNDYYSTNGNSLVLENEIEGYPVTAIGALAFANTENKPVKNVVVPSNIVKVGEKAFLNNVDMQSVIFLADEVTLEGTNNKDKLSVPFYGCATEANDAKTNLKIYYNKITGAHESDGGDYVWACFKVNVSGLIIKYYYVGIDPDGDKTFDYNFNGGGELHPQGSWCVLDVQVEGAEVVEELNFASLISERVSGGFKLDGVYTQAEAEALKAELTEILSAYRNEVDGDKYVVTVSLNETGACTRTLCVSVVLNQPKSVTLHSAVAMTYTVGSMAQAVAANADTVVYTTSVDETVTLYAPVAESGYVFLGWATDDGGMKFVGETVTYQDSAVYYAIWGFSKVGQEVKAQVNYSGNTFAAPESGNGKWYDNDWNEVTTVSKENLVVYTRAKFSFGYSVKGSVVTTIVDTGKNSTNKGSQNYSSNFDVLEGQKIKGVRTSGDHSFVIYVDDVQYTELKLEVYKVIGISGKWYTFKNDNLTNGEYNNNTVTGDCSLNLKY